MTATLHGRSTWGATVPALWVVVVCAALVALPGPLGREELSATPAAIVGAGQVVAGLALLLVVPVWLVRAKTDTGLSGVSHTYLSYALVLVGLMALVLVWNTTASAFGSSRPLAEDHLRALVVLVDLALIAWRPARTPGLPLGRLLSWSVTPLRWTHAPVGLAVVAMVTAIGGAITLNNGGGPVPAMLGLGLVGLTLGMLMVVPGSASRDASALTLLAAAVLLGTALRSWHVIGHDIQREFYFFQLAQSMQRWDIGAYADPYNACLSVTLLPVTVAALTGLSGAWVFKLVLPLLFAPVAAALYALAARFLPRPFAVTAVTLFLAFPTFYIDMAYLLRQATAFLFVAGFVLLAADKDEAGWRARVLAIVMGLGVVLSHYSTTYVLALTLLVAAAVRIGVRLARTRIGRPRLRDPFSVDGLSLLHPAVVVLVTAMSVTWSGAATDTGGNLRGVLGEALSAVASGEAMPEASELRRALFAPPESAQQKLDDYSREVLEETQESRVAGDYVATEPSEQFPRTAGIPDVEPTALGDLLRDVGVDTATATDRTRLAAGAGLQLLTAIGLVLLLLRPGRLPRLPEDLRWLAIGTAGAVLLFVVGPGLSAEYGFLRSLQQALIVWGTLAAATLVLLTRRLPGRTTVVVTLTVLIFLTVTGWTSRLVGGYSPQLNVADAGFYDALYDYTDAEVTGMRWATDLARERAQRLGDPPVVRTERGNTSRFMANVAPVGPEDGSTVFFGESFPSTIPVDSVVFLSRLAARDGMSTDFIGGDIISYTFPLEVLDRSKDLLYNNGFSRAYR